MGNLPACSACTRLPPAPHRTAATHRLLAGHQSIAVHLPPVAVHHHGQAAAGLGLQRVCLRRGGARRCGALAGMGWGGVGWEEAPGSKSSQQRQRQRRRRRSSRQH